MSRKRHKTESLGEFRRGSQVSCSECGRTTKEYWLFHPPNKKPVSVCPRCVLSFMQRPVSAKRTPVGAPNARSAMASAPKRRTIQPDPGHRVITVSFAEWKKVHGPSMQLRSRRRTSLSEPKQQPGAKAIAPDEFRGKSSPKEGIHGPGLRLPPIHLFLSTESIRLTERHFSKRQRKSGHKRNKRRRK